MCYVLALAGIFDGSSCVGSGGGNRVPGHLSVVDCGNSCIAYVCLKIGVLIVLLLQPVH